MNYKAFALILFALIAVGICSVSAQYGYGGGYGRGGKRRLRDD